MVVIFVSAVGLQTTRVMRRDRRLQQTNTALSDANKELFGLNEDLQQKTDDLDQSNQALQQKTDDLTVEAALERVRAKALEMKESEELSEVSETLYEEYEALGFDLFRFAITILDEEADTVEDIPMRRDREGEQFYRASFREWLKIGVQEKEAMEGLNEVEEDKVMLKKAKTFIKENPRRFVKLTLRRIVAFWFFANPASMNKKQLLQAIVYVPVVILAAIGILFSGRKRNGTALVGCLLVSYPVVYYITHVSFYRYRYPVEPFLILMASFAFVELLRRVWGGTRRDAVA